MSITEEASTEKTMTRGDEAPRFGLKPHIEASVHVNAPPEAVWAVIADVTRAGEWSGECLRCQWLGDTSSPEVGARFKGHNERRWLKWDRVNEIITADRPRELAWRTLSSAMYLDSTEWRITLQPEGSGTRVTEDMRIVRMSRPMDIFLYFINPPHRDRTADLHGDLQRLKEVVETEARDDRTG